MFQDRSVITSIILIAVIALFYYLGNNDLTGGQGLAMPRGAPNQAQMQQAGKELVRLINQNKIKIVIAKGEGTPVKRLPGASLTRNDQRIVDNINSSFTMMARFMGFGPVTPGPEITQTSDIDFICDEGLKGCKK